MGVVAGCGDEDDGSATAKPKLSAANEPPKIFINRIAKLIETSVRKRDCAQLDDFASRSFVRFECPSPKAFRRSMASFKVAGTAEYGTGAVVDYKSGQAKDGASILLFAGPDRKWGISRFGIIGEPTVGTEDEASRAGYEKALKGYLEAVESRDCDAYFGYIAPFGKTKKEICKQSFPSTASLAKKLKANASAEPQYRGGNARFGFYTLETSKPKPENVTISIVKATAKSDSYAILDVAPSPTAADQRRVRAAAEKQRRKQAKQKSMSQSSTTDN
jgi:hypothetical protein